MSKLSAKRQITLPVEQCRELGIEPGDDLEFYVANGYLTAIKQVPDAALGVLSHVKGDNNISDEQSRQSALK
ncbi:MAG: AbrB/MazE/SpoVT family DNA-binding domain-containing protein [Granulosicoccaceae bacterium]